jgi:hypothetical protein
MAMVQILRHLFGLGTPVADSLLEYCGYTHNTLVRALKPRAACPLDHRVPRQVASPRRAVSQSPGDIIRLAGWRRKNRLDLCALAVGGHVYVEKAWCRCGPLAAVHRFVPRTGHSPRCTACGAEMKAHPFFTHDPVSTEVLAPRLETPLGKLGVTSAGWAMVRGNGRITMVRFVPQKGQR